MATKSNLQPTVTTETTESGIRKVRTVHPITVDHVQVSQFEKEGTKQAQLRQQIVTKSYYPQASISNNLSDNLFAASDFSGLKEREYSSEENRVTWMTVPEDTTEEQMQEKLDSFPKACIYRILANRPILTENQQAAIRQRLRTMDDFADKQIVRHGKGAADEDGESIAGNLIFDANGKIQYKVNHFSMAGKADQDLRTTDVKDYYASEEIAEELEELFGATVKEDQIL